MIIKITTPERELLVEIDDTGVLVETKVAPGEGDRGVDADWLDLVAAGGDYHVVSNHKVKDALEKVVGTPCPDAVWEWMTKHGIHTAVSGALEEMRGVD